MQEEGGCEATAAKDFTQSGSKRLLICTPMLAQHLCVFGSAFEVRKSPRKIGAGVAAGVSEFTGKEDYRFGDVTKAAASKIGERIAAEVSKLTRRGEHPAVSGAAGRETDGIDSIVSLSGEA